MSANGGTIFFKSHDGIGRAVNYGGPSNSYRIIHATFIFGAIRGGSSAKNGLMQIYMNYLLGGGPQVEEEIIPIPLNLSVSPNPVTGKANLQFSLTKPGHVMVKVYNSTGQVIRNLIDSQMATGKHTLKWQCDDNGGRKLPSGTYIIRIESPEEKVNRVIVIVN